MLQEFEEHLDKNLPFLKENKVLIAISGGLDSVVLTHLCVALDMDVALAHCNFNLRGQESEEDEQFVLDLAEKLDLEVFIEKFDTEDHAEQNKLSIQMAARALRYDWFEGLSAHLGFRYVLTAHHADDNLETFLINLSRGTGLDGLTGIPEKNGNVIRPLLKFSREGIEEYAKINKLKWREDTSNASDKYLRNALRHHVIPKLKELNPKLLQNFGKTVSHLKDEKQITRDYIETLKKDIISRAENGEIHYNILELKKLSNPKAYLFHLLKDYGFTQWDDVYDLLEGQTGKLVKSSTHQLIKNRNVLIVRSIENVGVSSAIITDDAHEVQLEGGALLQFDEADSRFGKHSEVKNGHDKYRNSIIVDKDLLNFPLTVRGWQEGDYFYPFGMVGKKKLSKFLKDEKLSLFDKERIKLLCSGERIIWVIGKRADNRFKVTENTQRMLKITLVE